MFLILAACLPKNAAEVEALAEDPEEIDRLVRSLRSRKPEVWKTAYGELLEAGSEAASPELRESVIKRKTEAPRALLLLGELGDPANFDLLAGAQEVPALESWAEDAFVLAEESLYYHVRDDPSVELCEAYLLWFPDGQSVDEVEELLYDASAWAAYEALKRPDEVDLLSFVRAWPRSQAAQEAYRELAQLRVRAAQEELNRGRPERALDALAQARAYDPELDTTSLEATARQDLGRALLEHAEIDKAILELEEARRLGAKNGDLLGTLYVQRARDRFDRLQPVGAMEDLRRAERVNPELATTVGQIRDLQARTLLEQVRNGKRGDAVEAVLMSGPAHRDELDKVLMARVDEGDCVPLVQAAHVAEKHKATPWVRGELTRALQVMDKRVDTFLHPTSVEALLDGGAMFSLDSRSFRGEALGQLVCYERLVGAAQAQRDAGAEFGALLPAEAPVGDEELARLAAAGVSPSDAGRSKLFRAQLLRWVLEGPERLAALTQRNPALVAAALARTPEPPRDLVAWRLFEWELSEQGPETPVSVGGRAGRLVSERQGPTLRLVFELDDAGAVPPTDLGAPLTVLFGGARVVFFAMPAVDRVEVVVRTAGEEQAMLGLDRRSSERLSWSLIESEAPYGEEHLSLVLDQRLR